jgi:hypothetical protein
MREWRKPVDEWIKVGRAAYWEKWAVDYFLAEAELLLGEEKRR